MIFGINEIAANNKNKTAIPGLINTDPSCVMNAPTLARRNMVQHVARILSRCGMLTKFMILKRMMPMTTMSDGIKRPFVHSLIWNIHPTADEPDNTVVLMD